MLCAASQVSRAVSDSIASCVYAGFEEVVGNAPAVELEAAFASVGVC